MGKKQYAIQVSPQTHAIVRGFSKLLGESQRQVLEWLVARGLERMAERRRVDEISEVEALRTRRPR